MDCIDCGCNPSCGTICVDTTLCGVPIPGLTITLTRTAIDSVSLGSGGSGYTNGTGYAATLTGGGGSGASIHFDVVGGAVTNLQLIAGGSAWTSAPTIGFGAAGSGTGASATATLSTSTIGTCVTDGQVVTLTTSNAGSGYTTIPAVTLTGGGGSGAAASAVMGLNGPTVASGGSGYAVNDILTVVGGTGTAGKLRVSAVSGGVVTAAVVFTSGSYTALPTSPASVTGGTGTGATFNIKFNVVSLTLASGGTGYISNPALTVDPPPSGTTAVATATIAARCCIPIPESASYKAATTYIGTDFSANITNAPCTGSSQTLASIAVTNCDSTSWPSTLTATTPAGTVTLTQTGGSGASKQYTGTGTFSSSRIFNGTDGSGNCILISGSAIYTVAFSCSAGCTTLSITFYIPNLCGGGCSFNTTVINLNAYAVPGRITSFTNSPLNAAFTMTDRGTPSGDSVCGNPLPGTVTVTP